MKMIIYMYFSGVNESPTNYKTYISSNDSGFQNVHITNWAFSWTCIIKFEDVQFYINNNQVYFFIYLK